MSNKKYKLHPATTIINFIKAFKDLLVPIVILLVANGFKINIDIHDENFIGQLITIILLFLFVIYSLINGILKWWTFTYWFEDSELRVEYGLFIKKKRYIPFDRIQSLNYKEGILHRLFGLVQVMVETAGSKNGKPEAELTAVTKQAADQIEREMRKAKQVTTTLEEVEEIVVAPVKVVHKMTTGELLLLATTSSGIGVVIAGMLAVVSQFADLIPFDLIYEEVSYLIKYSFLIISLLVVVALFLSWIFSVCMTFLSYYDFTVTEENERLIITRGLLEKKRITIPLNRIQAVKIVENPFRQLLGLATVVVESAGGGFGGEAEKKIVLFPLISKKAALQPLRELFTQFDFTFIPEVQSPKRARPFFYRLDLFWLIPVIVALCYFFFPYGFLSLLFIIPILLLGVWQHKTAGFKITEQQLMIISRNISRVTFFAEKNRIQVVQSNQSYFQKRKNIVTARIVVMSGMNGASAKARHMEQQHIEEILHWYERK